MTVNEVADLLQEAHGAFDARDWAAARAAYLAARERGALPGDALYRLGTAVWWLGQFDDALAYLEASYQRFHDEGRPRGAATSAIFIAYTYSIRGESAVASGWMSRAYRILNAEPPCVEHGYLAYHEFENALNACDDPAALERARRVQEYARRYDDVTLAALGILAEGRALVRQGQVSQGMQLLDEAMLAARSNDLRATWQGNIYCHLMIACHELADIRRAAEWTDAISGWWSRRTAFGPYLGVCRAYRAHVLQIKGAWEQAEQEAAFVCSPHANATVNSLGEAHYQLGELSRLRGDLAAAEASYRSAHHFGRDPQPGLALLRLAQGRIDIAQSSIQAAVSATANNRLARARISAAQIEIALAAGDLATALAAEEDLDETTRIYQSSGLTAASLQARGTILLAEGKPNEALPVLRSACLWWQELSAPYETARIRCLLARAYHLLDDADAATREMDAANALFTSLGLAADCRAGAGLFEPAEPERPGGLTEREVDVLRLVAAGLTNRAIADELFISQKTVARHLANIFTKLDLTSRTAAAAYAIEQGLTAPPRGSSAP